MRSAGSEQAQVGTTCAMKGPDSGLPELLSNPGALLPPACQFLGPTASFLVSPKLALPAPLGF